MGLKILATSDLHGNLPEISKEDIHNGNIDALVIGGDICPHGSADFQLGWVIRDFRWWLDDLKKDIPNIICIAGNHDFAFEKYREKIELHLNNDNFIYLEDSFTTINGYKIWGSPWSKKFLNWIFMKEEPQLAYTYSSIPDDVDILISHGPPLGYGDLNNFGDHLGSMALYDSLFRINPSLLICGHIHEARGHYRIPLDNSVCDLYNVAQSLVEISI